jgi:hypothetical protein
MNESFYAFSSWYGLSVAIVSRSNYLQNFLTQMALEKKEAPIHPFQINLKTFKIQMIASDW